MRWLKTLAVEAVSFVNLLTQGFVRRKFLVTNQERFWGTRGKHWLEEDASANADPYYEDFDCKIRETLAGLEGDSSFLEVGCFYGRRLSQIREKLSGRKVVGVDRALGPLQTAQSRSPGGVVQAQAERLPFRTGAFDCVYTVVCLTHIPRRSVRQAISEMWRVAKRHMILIEVYDKPMAWPARINAWRWGGGYCHPYETLLAFLPSKKVTVRGLPDGIGHARYTLFECIKDES